MNVKIYSRAILNDLQINENSTSLDVMASKQRKHIKISVHFPIFQNGSSCGIKFSPFLQNINYHVGESTIKFGDFCWYDFKFQFQFSMKFIDPVGMTSSVIHTR